MACVLLDSIHSPTCKFLQSAVTSPITPLRKVHMTSKSLCFSSCWPSAQNWSTSSLNWHRKLLRSMQPFRGFWWFNLRTIISGSTGLASSSSWSISYCSRTPSSWPISSSYWYVVSSARKNKTAACLPRKHLFAASIQVALLHNGRGWLYHPKTYNRVIVKLNLFLNPVRYWC